MLDTLSTTVAFATFASWIAIVYVVLYWARVESSLRTLISVWLFPISILLSVNLVIRLTGLYEGPTAWYSALIAMVYIVQFITLVGFLHINSKEK